MSLNVVTHKRVITKNVNRVVIWKFKWRRWWYTQWGWNRRPRDATETKFGYRNATPTSGVITTTTTTTPAPCLINFFLFFFFIQKTSIHFTQILKIFQWFFFSRKKPRFIIFFLSLFSFFYTKILLEKNIFFIWLTCVIITHSFFKLKKYFILFFFLSLKRYVAPENRSVARNSCFELSSLFCFYH